MKKSANGNRILVVEDEPIISTLCLRVLTGEGLTVDIAVNGQIAGKMLEQRDYTLCIIDIRTPVMSGQELFHIISKTHPGMIDRVIFTTGDVIGKDTQSFLDQAGRPFLPKPFSPEELRAVVRSTLEQVKRPAARHRSGF